MRRLLLVARHVASTNMPGLSSQSRGRSTTPTTQQPQRSMSYGYLNQADAAALDDELMTTYSTDQLMELAGLSAAQAMLHYYGTPKATRRVVVLCGPGNNGGDGLVVARHLSLFRFASHMTVVYPALDRLQGEVASLNPRVRLYHKLVELVRLCGVPVVPSLSAADLETGGGGSEIDGGTVDDDCCTIVVDALFGYSFRGEVREPYRSIISCVNRTHCRVVSVDVPSGWDVERGPELLLPETDVQNRRVQIETPEVLVSLMLPKLGVRCVDDGSRAGFAGRPIAHYLGGRFVPELFRAKHNLAIPEFPKGDQFVRLS